MRGFRVRWVRTGMAVVALGCLGVGMGTATAGATTPVKGNPSVSEPFVVGDDCGFPGGATIGQATISRSGERIRVSLALRGAEPHTAYPVDIFFGTSWEDYCDSSEWIGTIHTSNTGGGVLDTSFLMVTDVSVFFLATFTDEWSETPVFCLPEGL